MGRLLFLGTGASLGVPVVGCSCDICQSNSVHNQRRRTSACLFSQGKVLLIDAGPDLRAQALHFNLRHLDGVIFTHAHHDHTAGIDELRAFHFLNQASVPCLAHEQTARELNLRFDYMFRAHLGDSCASPRLALQTLLENEGTTDFLGLNVRYFTYLQQGMIVVGYRFGALAYVTDIKEYSSTLFKALEGIEILVISALRYTPSHMHLTVDEAVDFAHKTSAKEVWLTHLSHELDWEKTNNYLPPEVRLAYDGLNIWFSE